MRLTLNKANRLLQQLKSRRSYRHHDYLAAMPTFSLTVRLSDCNDELRTTLEEQYRRRRETLDNRLQICQDYYRLRESLFAANQRCGISQRLSDIDLCRELLNLYKHTQSQYADSKVVPLRVEAIDPQQLREDLKHMEGKTELEIQVITPAEIEQQIQSLTSRIDQLEDEITRLNNQETLEIELSEASLQLMGTAAA